MICIFYLTLRALDTIEDDTHSFVGKMQLKIDLLVSFHTRLDDLNWFLSGIGEHDEEELLRNFYRISRVFATFTLSKRTVIKDITRKMGAGMAEFVPRDMSTGTSTIEQYNRYCYFVAGLVGEGLSSLFVSSGLEQNSLSCDLQRSHTMGLFLQKTNIIRYVIY